MMNHHFKDIYLQALHSTLFNGIHAFVLRLDVLHKVVSGNKWFKLKYYLEEAKQKQCTTIATFGGAYSNHVVATAYACKELGFKSMAYIRGEQPATLSHTLQAAMEYGMQLHYLSRNNYFFMKHDFTSLDKKKYIIPEGGYGVLGAKGAATILDNIDVKNYDYIIAACGTGTTVAGLLNACKNSTVKVIGINVLKGYENLYADILKVADEDVKSDNLFIYDYPFGGYAKYTPELILWMNDLYKQENIPTDFVYTAKLFYAVKDLYNKKILANNSKVLIIHSGGLQGNLSLPANTLSF